MVDRIIDKTDHDIFDRTDYRFFPGLMPFCGEAAKRHYKGLTIDEILRMVYNRLKLHVGSNIDLA